MISRSATTARCAAATAAILSTAFLAACGNSGSPHTGQPATPTSTTSPPAAGTSTAPATTPPASAGPSAGATAACATSALTMTVAVNQAGGAAGSSYYPIDFRNNGSSPCTLFGFPGVSFASSKGGSEIGSPASRQSVAATHVSVPAGGYAHAVLQVADAGNYSVSTCSPVTAHWLRVYPPGQTAPGYTAFTARVCSARLPQKLGTQLSIFPVRSGRGQQGQTP